MDRVTAERAALDREDRIRLTPDEEKRRRSRSVAIALVLGGLAILFFAVTIAKLGLQG